MAGTNYVHATVGAAISRPQRNGTARLVEWHAIRTHCRGGSQPPAFVPGQKCSVEWYHVRHSTNSPKLIRDCGFVPRGRLRASPTVLSWCCGNSPNPVHHFGLVLRGRLRAAPTVAWMSFVPAKLRFPILWAAGASQNIHISDTLYPPNRRIERYNFR